MHCVIDCEQTVEYAARFMRYLQTFNRQIMLLALCAYTTVYSIDSLFFVFFPPNRALYGYEAQSNCLKLIAKGDGGLVELADELNSGKIMYAFVSVQDPKTSLTKFLLINWQVSSIFYPNK